MLPLDSLLTFTAAMAALAFFPGPGAIALAARVLGSGFWRSLPMIAAMITGEMMFLGLAVFGLAILADTMGTLFAIVKYFGAAYLFYLGWSYWTAPAHALAITARRAERPGLMFFNGLVLTLGNPKVIVFYVALLPKVLDLSELKLLGYIQITLIGVALLLVSLITYALLAAKIRNTLSRAARVRRINRGVGAVLFAAGAGVAAA